MKKIDKLINEIEKMLEETNKYMDIAAAGYDEGFYVGKGEGLEEVLKLLKENNKIKG